MSAEREKFEAWATRDCPSNGTREALLSKKETGDYVLMSMCLYWQSWQARAEARPSVSGPVDRYSLMSGLEGYTKIATGEFVTWTDYDAQSSRIVELEKELAEARSIS